MTMTRFLKSLVVAAALLLAAPAYAQTATNIGTVTTTGAASISVTTGTVPAGALIFGACSEINFGLTTTPGSMADATNGTYTAVTPKAQGTGTTRGIGQIFYFPNSAALSSVSVTYTLGLITDGAACSFFYITGIKPTSPLDTSVTKQSSGRLALVALTSGTPSVAGEFFVAVLTADDSGGTTYTQDTIDSWVAPPTFAFNNAADVSVAGGGQINAGTGTIEFNPPNAATEFTDWAAQIVAFEPNTSYTKSTFIFKPFP